MYKKKAAGRETSEIMVPAPILGANACLNRYQTFHVRVVFFALHHNRKGIFKEIPNVDLFW